MPSKSKVSTARNRFRIRAPPSTEASDVPSRPAASFAGRRLSLKSKAATNALSDSDNSNISSGFYWSSSIGSILPAVKTWPINNSSAESNSIAQAPSLVTLSQRMPSLGEVKQTASGATSPSTVLIAGTTEQLPSVLSLALGIWPRLRRRLLSLAPIKAARATPQTEFAAYEALIEKRQTLEKI